MRSDFSGLTDHELMLELEEAELQLRECEQLGVNFVLGIAGYVPDTTELKEYYSQLMRELEQRRF